MLKTPYHSPADKDPPQFLVVDGVLPGGTDSSYIHLSYTRSLADTGTKKGLEQANLLVEDSSGHSFPLNPGGNGTYSALLDLKSGDRYRLRIHSPDNKEYLSDFVPYKMTPAIDRIWWKEDSSSVSVSLGTHDDSGDTRYYRWTYVEPDSITLI